ncbi:cyclic nucleotide-binding domain-containing protein 2-like [Protopterus annectens]|uniref:cyclic nucleotide-binding domain-containing protein 2-like n=1 Tax=Protopterus annectens TaxID=7888 RepID=UPI001CFA4D6F|nr:cyclic nucleotide-binding domain-containing protein 2-like [Protopterus annectens]
MRRPTSLICETDVELILIGKEDFEATLANVIGQRYRISYEFLRKLPIFSLWTSEKLELLLLNSLHRSYRAGTVVIQDISTSHFIVVVRSGRCLIVTHLRNLQKRMSPLYGFQRQWLSPVLTKFPSLSLLEGEMDFIEKTMKRPSTSPYISISDKQASASLTSLRQSRAQTAATSFPLSRKQNISSVIEHKGDNPRQTLFQGKHVKVSAVHPSSLSASTKFLRIGFVEQGGIFGLTEVMGKKTDLHLSLISDGAECIFIPKKLYTAEAPTKSRQFSVERGDIYPMESTIRQKYIRQQAWQEYKSRVVKEVLQNTGPRPVTAHF